MTFREIAQGALRLTTAVGGWTCWSRPCSPLTSGSVLSIGKVSMSYDVLPSASQRAPTTLRIRTPLQGSVLTDYRVQWTILGIDVNIITECKVCNQLDPCYANPVKLGLVDRAEQLPVRPEDGFGSVRDGPALGNG